MPLVLQLLVHAEEIAYLAASYADVTCRNVLVRTYMAVQLGHERLAETHYLGIAASAYGEVGTTLAAAHGQCCERVFECLFKSEELKYREVCRRVEAQTALIRTYRAVKLHAVTKVYVHLTAVVDPWNAECDDAFRLYDALDNLCFLKLRMLVVHILYGNKHFSDCLQVLCLTWMPLLKVNHNFLNIHSSIF